MQAFGYSGVSLGLTLGHTNVCAYICVAASTIHFHPLIEPLNLIESQLSGKRLSTISMQHQKHQMVWCFYFDSELIKAYEKLLETVMTEIFSKMFQLDFCSGYTGFMLHELYPGDLKFLLRSLFSATQVSFFNFGIVGVINVEGSINDQLKNVPLLEISLIWNALVSYLEWIEDFSHLERIGGWEIGSMTPSNFVICAMFGQVDMMSTYMNDPKIRMKSGSGANLRNFSSAGNSFFFASKLANFVNFMLKISSFLKISVPNVTIAHTFTYLNVSVTDTSTTLQAIIVDTLTEIQVSISHTQSMLKGGPLQVYFIFFEKILVLTPNGDFISSVVFCEDSRVLKQICLMICFLLSMNFCISVYHLISVFNLAFLIVFVFIYFLKKKGFSLEDIQIESTRDRKYRHKWKKKRHGNILKKKKLKRC
ncbi:hypothetical protein VP01_887g4 [Puccinia sorghi]|uniref:Uncharacterized protein n=1 Tax=Puccinia sorghi TaxID=27349 RepID=A0A0L6U856_9BASI|nr:hypothetical protein VP01_887g4 [Puccinia sorghi]